MTGEDRAGLYITVIFHLLVIIALLASQIDSALRKGESFMIDFSKQEASGKYVCSICGYVYDPAEHDGVAFEDLPDDWRCPRCKQPKEKFNKA